MSQSTPHVVMPTPTVHARPMEDGATRRVSRDEWDRLTSVTIGGAPVHLTDERAARVMIARASHESARRPLAVCSINLDHVHHFEHAEDDFGPDAPVRWLNLIDGAPIAKQVQRMTTRSYPRLAGSDIIQGVLTDASASGLAVAVVGGSAEVTEALRGRLAEAYPGVRFAGHWTPPREALPSRDECLRLCGELRTAQADIVLVCLGKPRQERWIAQYGPDTGARVLLAFGAVVDFLAGKVSRAPGWVSRAGAEWMWRLMLEPRRLARRYLIEGPPAYRAVRASGNRPQ